MTDPDPSATVRVPVGGDDPGRGRALADAAREAAPVPVRTVGPAGHEGLAPLVALTRAGRTTLFAAPEPDRLRELVADLDDELPTAGALAVVDHDPGTDDLPVPADGPLAVGRRRVLGPCGWARPTDPRDFPGPVPDRTAVDPDGALARLRERGLLGRGRGDAVAEEPVARAWATAREADGDPLVVVNAADADDGARADRLLVESATVAVLDGALAAAIVVDATDVVVRVGSGDALAAERLREAADALDVAERVQVVAGDDSFVAGEPTVALEDLEGNDRLEARRTPPGPAEHGLYGRPTLVHTPRTLVHVCAALAEPDAYDADLADPGSRLVTVAGDVAAPATVELPTGAPLARATDAVEPAGEVKSYAVGGRFGGFTRSLDVDAAAPALRAAGLGTEGVVELLSADRCVVASAGERARFAAEENCGRCVPCREGSTQLTQLLRNVYDGEFAPGKLRELARTMRRTSACGFGVAAARPVTTALAEFEPEFRAHAEGDCPAGVCR